LIAGLIPGQYRIIDDVTNVDKSGARWQRRIRGNLARVAQNVDRVQYWVVLLSKAAESGSFLDLAPSESDPTRSSDWPRERWIPAEAVRTVLTRHDLNVDPRGVRVRGARIIGELDLSHVSFAHPLQFYDCVFDSDCNFNWLSVKDLALVSCVTQMVQLKGVNTTHNFAAPSSVIHGGIVAYDARIGGQVFLDNAVVHQGENDFALNFDGATIKADLFADGLTIHGELRAVRTRIEGNTILNDSHIVNPGGFSVRFDAIEINGSLYMNGFTSDGNVCVDTAQIGGQLSLLGAGIRALPGTDRPALSLDSSHIDGGIFAGPLERGSMTCNTTIFGGLSAMHAQIGKQVILRYASLIGEGLEALNLAFANIDGPVLADAIHCTGTVLALGAKVQGNIVLSGATLSNPAADALTLSNVEVTNQLMANDGFRCDGAVRAWGIHIGGELCFFGASLNNPDGDALDADHASIVKLHLPNDVVGGISLESARIGDLATSDRPSKHLNAVGWEIAKLSGPLRNNWRAADNWLSSGRIDGRLSQSVQPWHALAAAYELDGDLTSGRKLRTSAANIVMRQSPPFTRVALWIYGLIVGYGYRPLRAALWLLVMVAISWLIVANTRGDIVPTDMASAETHAVAASTAPLRRPITAEDSCDMHPGYPCFNSFTFAVNNLVPSASMTTSNTQWIVQSGATTWLILALPIIKLASWVLAALLLAGVTGLLRKTGG
jgi:hypothetical protein